jgi:hypothetical protein
VGSRDAAKAKAFCEEHAALPKAGGMGIGMTYGELLARDDLDALYCPLPTGLRNEWISKAIEAGKHIYSEKPMVGTPACGAIPSIITARMSTNHTDIVASSWLHARARHKSSNVSTCAFARVLLPCRWYGGRAQGTSRPVRCSGSAGGRTRQASLTQQNPTKPNQPKCQ